MPQIRPITDLRNMAARVLNDLTRYRGNVVKRCEKR